MLCGRAVRVIVLARPARHVAGLRIERGGVPVVGAHLKPHEQAVPLHRGRFGGFEQRGADARTRMRFHDRDGIKARHESASAKEDDAIARDRALRLGDQHGGAVPPDQGAEAAA